MSKHDRHVENIERLNKFQIEGLALIAMLQDPLTRTVLETQLRKLTTSLRTNMKIVKPPVSGFIGRPRKSA